MTELTALQQRLAKDMPEKSLLASVRELAEYSGWLVYHTHNSQRSDPGFPDLVLLRPPRLVFVELKTEKGKPTGYQNRWLNLLADIGAGTDPFSPVETYLWRPTHWFDGTIKTTLTLPSAVTS